jgi:hypothetical protein
MAKILRSRATAARVLFVLTGERRGATIRSLLQSMNTPSVMSARVMWRESFLVGSCALGLGVAKKTRTLPEYVAGQDLACRFTRLYAQFSLDKSLRQARLS